MPPSSFSAADKNEELKMNTDGTPRSMRSLKNRHHSARILDGMPTIWLNDAKAMAASLMTKTFLDVFFRLQIRIVKNRPFQRHHLCGIPNIGNDRGPHGVSCLRHFSLSFTFLSTYYITTLISCPHAQNSLYPPLTTAHRLTYPNYDSCLQFFSFDGIPTFFFPERRGMNL